MKIKNVTMTGFMGIKNTVTVETPHIVALVGRNGIGKTTLMSAIRFVLTGAEPAGDIINKENITALVEITLIKDDGSLITFSRLRDRNNPSQFMVDHKKTTQKALNEQIVAVTGIPIDKIEILNSADILAAMKPQEFGSLILGYIPEKLKLEKVIDFMPVMTPGIMDIMDANLPSDGIDLTVLDEFDAMCRSTRKELKSDLAAKQLMLKEHTQEKPEENKADIERRLKELDTLESEFKVYQAKLEAYEREVESRNKIKANIKAMQEEADGISVSRPDPVKESELKDKETKIRESITNQMASLTGIKTALGTLKETVESLDKAFCPISPLITCGQDKSAAKQEILDTIAATEESERLLETEIQKLRDELEKIASEQVKMQEEQKQYQKKMILLRQIKQSEEAVATTPIKPAPVEKVDVADERFKLNQTLKLISEYEAGQMLVTQISALTEELNDYEALVKAMSEKGPVRNGIVNAYLGIFESICNERSQKIRPEISFSFESDNGVVVRMKGEKGAWETYDELSGGERAYMIYVIMDMLNQLIGTRLLLLDELSVMDQDVFKAFVDMVLNYSADYDHIILSAVDHKDTLEILESHEVKVINKII